MHVYLTSLRASRRVLCSELSEASSGAQPEPSLALSGPGSPVSSSAMDSSSPHSSEPWTRHGGEREERAGPVAASPAASPAGAGAVSSLSAAGGSTVTFAPLPDARRGAAGGGAGGGDTAVAHGAASSRGAAHSEAMSFSFGVEASAARGAAKAPAGGNTPTSGRTGSRPASPGGRPASPVGRVQRADPAAQHPYLHASSMGARPAEQQRPRFQTGGATPAKPWEAALAAKHGRGGLASPPRSPPRSPARSPPRSPARSVPVPTFSAQPAVSGTSGFGSFKGAAAQQQQQPRGSETPSSAPYRDDPSPAVVAATEQLARLQARRDGSLSTAAAMAAQPPGGQQQGSSSRQASLAGVGVSQGAAGSGSSQGGAAAGAPTSGQPPAAPAAAAPQAPAASIATAGGSGNAASSGGSAAGSSRPHAGSAAAEGDLKVLEPLFQEFESLRNAITPANADADKLQKVDLMLKQVMSTLPIDLFCWRTAAPCRFPRLYCR